MYSLKVREIPKAEGKPTTKSSREPSKYIHGLEELYRLKFPFPRRSGRARAARRKQLKGEPHVCDPRGRGEWEEKGEECGRGREGGECKHRVIDT